MQSVSKLICEMYRTRRPVVSATMTITRGDAEYEISISGRFVKGSPGSRYSRFGDPGDPPEPDEIDGLTATDQNNAEVALTDDEIQEATDILINQATDFD